MIELHGTPIEGIRTTNQATTETEQVRKVFEEAMELVCAVAYCEGDEDCLEEAIDVVKAASKLIKDNFSNEQIAKAFELNDIKNKERGYCD